MALKQCRCWEEEVVLSIEARCPYCGAYSAHVEYGDDAVGAVVICDNCAKKFKLGER